MKRHWLVGVYVNGFQMKMLVYSTEQEMWAYLNSEIGGGDDRHTGNYSYHGATDKEVEMAKMLGIKCYLCPEI